MIRRLPLNRWWPDAVATASGAHRFRLMFLVAISVLVAAAIYTSLLIVERQESLQAISRYNVTWLLSQSIQEVIRLEAVIGASTIPGAGKDREDVELWLDIVASRLLLLDSGEVREFITSSEDLKAIRDDMRDAVASARPLVNEFDKPGNARILLKKFEDLSPRWCVSPPPATHIAANWWHQICTN
jgi:hypothetical protein